MMQKMLPIWEGDSPTTWWAKLDFMLVDVFDRMPMRKPGVADIWYATISYGDKSTSARFVWPKGNDANVFTMLKGVPIEGIAQKCHPDYEAVDREWGWGDDDRFYRDFVKPLLAVALLMTPSSFFCAMVRIFSSTNEAIFL